MDKAKRALKRLTTLPPLVEINGKAEIAAALSHIERDFGSDAVTELLEEAFKAPRGTVIGLTGPPGAGKSTLINSLIAEWRKEGGTVAVLAIDPSSRTSGGALLGDRVRMRSDPRDAGVFIRSVAARGRLGGLADIAYPAAIFLRALFDKVIVESVGVGQSETDIAIVSDTVVLCIQPASGDVLQFMKAGIAEIPDIAVVTKADLGAAATQALTDLKGAFGLCVRDPCLWTPECLCISVIEDSGGIRRLLTSLQRHEAWLKDEGRLEACRDAKAREWVVSEITAQFGRAGLDMAANELGAWSSRPFALARRAVAEFSLMRRSLSEN